MKTASLISKSLTGFRSAVLLGAVLLAALPASRAIAAPVVVTISGGDAKTFYGPAMDPDTNSLRAVYHTPLGLALDEAGANLYVADENNNAIRMLDLQEGFTFTLFTNTIQPVAVALDGSGNLYVLERGSGSTLNTNGMIVEYDTQFFDIIATNATHLVNPTAMAIDLAGDIFVAAHTNQLIEISGTNQAAVATVTQSNALLEGITLMPNGQVAACDYNRDGIYDIDPNTGIVTTNAGFNGQGDGTGINNLGVQSSKAKFFHPFGIAASGDGSLIVSDFGNDRVKVITASGVVTNFYGVSSNYWNALFFPGWADGTVKVPDQPSDVASRSPAGVILSPDGTTVYTTEDYYHLVRQITGGNFQKMPSLPPQAPSGLTATLLTNAQQQVEVLLNWSEPSDAGVTNYVVERSSSTNSFSILGTTNGTSFIDANVTEGATYFYVVQAENDGGLSGLSGFATVTIPVPPPPAPNIGWYDFEGNSQTGFLSTMHPVTSGNPYTSFNLLQLAIDPTEQGDKTKYITVPPYTNGTPVGILISNGHGAPVYENNQLIGSDNVNSLPPLTLSNGTVTIEAININGQNEPSSVASATFTFEVAAPEIIAPNGNAAQFTLEDVTTNVIYYYTLDGTDPTNAPFSQQVVSTNGNPVTISLDGATNIFFQVRAIGYGPDAGFLMSGIAQQFFSSASFQPNAISWGFAQGECSSKFTGASGQTFYAPVTLTMLPGVPLYSLQFDMTVSSTGPGVTNSGPATTSFNFQPLLEEPVPGVTPVLYEPIPPLMFAGYASNPPPQLITYNGINDFVSLTNIDGNQLAVGWLERAGATNLYDSTKQTLITFSQAHDDLFPDAAIGEPNGVIVGGYGFQIPGSAVNGQQYQLTINRASGTDNGVGNPGSAVDIFAGNLTNAGAMGAGSLNGIKIVTVGSIPYLVGNAYPFGWFNAGDFGNSNLQSADLEQVFESAVYGLNTPPTNSDFFDSMDSCGSLGFQDLNPSDEFYEYYTNAGLVTPVQRDDMYNGDYAVANNMVFGDVQLDISDIYLTFLRSEFTNNFIWYQRLWTNGVRVATASYAPGIEPSVRSRLASQVTARKPIAQALPLSITNTPGANFTTTDFLASAGQTLTVPINATVFGPYPARMLMISVNVVPLDGSPQLSTPVQFQVNPALSGAIGTTTPVETRSVGPGNYSAAWLPSGISANALPQVPGFSNTLTIGTLTVTIPRNASASSSYAINFAHASASPSGILSLPSKTCTGLITLSSRDSSSYNDGIPDSWRLRYFGTIYNQLSVSNADADGTGMNNWQKYHAGLNPVDPTSVLNEGIDQSASQSPQDFVLYWPSVTGQTYVIERSPTLFPAHWTAISTNIGDGTFMEIHDPSGKPGGYYQVTTQ